MKRRRPLALVAAVVAGLVLALSASVVLTAPDTAIPWSVFGAGGNSSSSTNYELGSTAGQSSPIGESESTNYRLGAGFWYGVSLVIPNTPVGQSVPLDLGSGVTITFDNVNAAGFTSLTTSGSGPPPPAGFRIGAPPVYYDISTTASFTGNVEVCIDYDESAFVNEASLKLFHRENSAWTEVTTLLDTVINRICGSVSSFSLFLPAEQPFGVGGIAELPEVAGTPLETDGSSRANVGIAVAVAAAAVVLASAGWYARRRWLR